MAMTTKEALSRLNELRTAGGRPPLRSWRASRAKLDAALAEASAAAEARTGAAEAPRPPRGAGPSRRGIGVGALAELLIVEHPEWTYARIARAVNERIEGAQASEKSVRWYSHQMRRRGVDGTTRVRRQG